jgi:hypothetical protein
MEKKFSLPTETVDLPSQGKLYPSGSALASGKLEMKYMTAKEEDILTNQNYIQKGIVIDKLLESLIVTKINYGDLLVGDKNAIMVAARILSYGKDYTVKLGEETIDVDLSTFDNKPLHPDVGDSNEFEFKLPSTDNTVTFKLLTHDDDNKIDREVAGLKKINKDSSATSSTRLKHMITSVNGLREQKDIREFVDNYLLARDARALREYYTQVAPDVDMTISYTNADGVEEDIDLPITINFFWPDARV